jgi:hypothetical protein
MVADCFWDNRSGGWTFTRWCGTGFRDGHGLWRSAVLRILAVLPLLLLVTGTYCRPAGAVGSASPSLYAVVVGVTRFADPSIPPLNLSTKDARDFYTFLDERKGAFKSAHLTLLTEEKATRANITDALRNKLRTAGKDDIVIIYLSGHGAQDAAHSNEFYFVTHDARRDNLFGTALLMNDTHLFRGIASERCLLLADACHAAGFIPGLGDSKAKSVVASLFQGTRGRVAIASSSPDEKSYEKSVYGNSVFTHFLLKGMRGEAAKQSGDKFVSARELYDFVAKETQKATNDMQHPQFYGAVGANDQAPVFPVRRYGQPLKVAVQFQYEDDQRSVRPLTEGSVLRSGGHVGITFRPESDCFVYVFWWDSKGSVGRLFPNPKLCEGSSAVKAQQTYWLPSLGGECWYVLDDQQGEETICFVASRERNPKLESLYDKLTKMSEGVKAGTEGQAVTRELERQINLMGFADRVARKSTGSPVASDRRRLFESLAGEISVSGADSIVKVSFRHIQ